MNNKYDEKYDIRIANIDDIEDIMKFINIYWKKNHIMAVNRGFFEYEFLEDNGTVNFILAIDKEKGTIESLVGILKSSHIDGKMDLFSSFWKTKEGNMPFLGLELIKRKLKLFQGRESIGIGVNPNTALPIVKLLGRYTDKMQHFYMLSDKENYKLAKISNKFITNMINNYSEYDIVEYDNFNKLKQRFDYNVNQDIIPYKDLWYIEHRFYKYPIYKYKVYGIEKNGKSEAVFVLRNDEYANRIAIRMVDFIGKQEYLQYIGGFLRKKLDNDKVEYVDFYAKGFDEKYILNAGFKLRDENDINVIPNYFHPFLQENIDIYISSTNEKTRFTKADGDQDRPN